MTKKSVRTFVGISVLAAAVAASLHSVAAQGTENLPSNSGTTKDYIMLGTPTLNPDGEGPILPQIPAATVPEPGTSVLLLAGAGALTAAALRRGARKKF